MLNTWEAVYFETDLAHRTELADVAAQVGVERFVLDDGWLGGGRAPAGVATPAGAGPGQPGRGGARG